MLHLMPTPAFAFAGARGLGPAIPGDVGTRALSLRAMHALMLAYAAQRRRAAVDCYSSRYWKAAERHALAKACAIRVGQNFPRIP